MKILLSLIAVLLMVSIALAVDDPCGPYIDGELYPTSASHPDYFLVKTSWEPTIPVTQVNPQTVGGAVRLHYNVSSAPVGSNTIRVQACVNDHLWGEVCGAETPLTFTRPPKLAVKTLSVTTTATTCPKTAPSALKESRTPK